MAENPADGDGRRTPPLRPGVLFDLDGTLVDTNYLHTMAWSRARPDVFVAAMRAGGVDPARALAVGDSVWDIRAARAAGIGCVAVETGGFSRHELSETGARHVYRSVEELFQQFHTSPLAALLAPVAGE